MSAKLGGLREQTSDDPVDDIGEGNYALDDAVGAADVHARHLVLDHLIVSH